MKSYACVTHLVEHIVSETKKVFKGTTYEDNCFFYHDALLLMTAKKTREWMAEKGYDKMWILPEKNLYQDDPALKAYVGRPAVNSPELCNLDSNLNEDAHKSVEHHVRMTEMIEKDDLEKF